MYKRGGGVIDIKLENTLKDIVFYILVDVKDSMGANTVNNIIEGIATKLASIYKGKVLMSIMSNLCPERLAKSVFEIPVECLSKNGISGLDVAKRIV